MTVFGEAVKPILRMVAGLDGNENADRKPDPLLIHQGDPLENDAVGFKALDTLPAWRRRQSDARADLGDRERCVILQDSKDFPVDGIHELDFPRRLAFYLLERKIFSGKVEGRLACCDEAGAIVPLPLIDPPTAPALSARKASTSARVGAPAEPPMRRAFYSGDRGAEAHRFDLASAFGERQRKAAVKRIAGAERIDGGRC